jgi:hypothetical protein
LKIGLGFQFLSQNEKRELGNAKSDIVRGALYYDSAIIAQERWGCY